MDYPLGIGIIPIPDGVQDKDRLRLSLVVEVSPGMNTVADLTDWPAAIARAAGASASSAAGAGLVVSFFDQVRQPIAGFDAITPLLHPAIRLASAEAGARVSWRRLFPAPQLGTLYAALSAPEVPGAEASSAAERVQHYRAGAIAAAATQLREGAISPTIRARALAAELMTGKHKKLSSRTVARIAENARAPFRFLFERTLLDALAPPFDGLSKAAPRLTVDLGAAAPEPIDIATLNRKVQQGRLAKALQKARKSVAPAPSEAEAKAEAEAEGALSRLTEITDRQRERLLDRLLLGSSLGTADRGALDDAVERAIGTTLAIDLAQKVEEFASTFADVRGDPRVARAAACEKGLAATPELEFKEAVHEKYTGLRARPALAKLLNMVIDVTVPYDGALPRLGFVRVSFAGDAMRKDLPLVAYWLEASVFRPAASGDVLGTSADPEPEQRALPLQDGMVRLRDGRFRLSMTDVHSLVNASRVKLGEHRAAQHGGADQRDLSPRMMEERGRGIQLLDDRGLESLVANLAGAGDAQLLFAEDLVIGYRAFVRRRKPGKDKPHAWCALMARTVRYDDVRRVYPVGRNEAGPSWSPYTDEPEREHGYVRPMPRMQGSADSGAVAPSHIFTWTGNSLGLPAADPKGQSTDLSCEESTAERLRIGAAVTYRHPDRSAYPMAALRVGNSYEFGLAPVYLHGGGPTLAQAAKTLDAKSQLVLGSYGNSEPFAFGQPGDVQAPVLLLSPGDRLVSGTPAPRNEHVERIVLRTGVHENTGQVTRFLAPPRVDFGGAEQFGVFDQLNHQPRGAFTGYRRDRHGDFHSVKSPAPQGDGKPEHLYVLTPGEAPRDAPPYFPDPLGRNVSLAFERDEETARGFPDMLPPLAFWPENDGDPYVGSQQADVLRLDFVRWQDAREGGRVKPDGVGRRTAMTLEIAQAEEVNLWVWCWPDLQQFLSARPQLIWPLARGLQMSETDLAERWSKVAGSAEVTPSSDPVGEFGMDAPVYARARGLERHFRDIARGLGADKGAANERAALMQATERLLFHMLPLNGVTGWRKLALVHAVDKPLSVPAIASGALKPVRLEAGVTLQERAAAKELTDMRGGTTLFFIGAIEFHRASTGALRLEANWPNLEHGVAVIDIAPPGAARRHYVDRPPRVDRILLDVRDIPRAHGENAEGSFNLLTDELGRYRELKTGSDTTGPSATAARRMSLRLVATSRFVNYFAPDARTPSPGTLGKFEVESRRQRTGGPQPAPLPGEVFYEVIVAATARPPMPVVSRIDWIAPEQRVRSSDSQVVVKKSFYPRLYLDNSYRVSGEDELFALTFLPAGAIKERAYEPNATPTEPGAGLGLDGRFVDEFSRFGIDANGAAMLPPEVCEATDASPLCGTLERESLQMVTRWGVDPATAPIGRLEALMSPERFHGHVAALAAVPMPLPDTTPDQKGIQPMVTVGALLYRPQLEAHTGRWYIDIGIDPGAAHAPFVRLSIARYQPLALTAPVDLRMSAPLLLDPFRVPASRTVEVRHAPGQPIAVSVYGVGYIRREPYGVSDAVRHLTDTPLQNIELMRASQTEPAALLQAYDRAGVAQRRNGVQPARSGPLLHWHGEFDVSDDPRRQRYALVIDEVDMHIPDRVIDAVALTKPKPRADAPIAKGLSDLLARPGFFSLTIEL